MQIGLDCQIILDGIGYFIKPGSYLLQQPRLRTATQRMDGNLSYVDFGAGKRNWQMTILCLNDLLRYDGQPTGLSGQYYRDALRTSYLSTPGTTIQYRDPLNTTAIAVHFDSYSEKVHTFSTQQVPLSVGASAGLTYEVSIILLEAW